MKPSVALDSIPTACLWWSTSTDHEDCALVHQGTFPVTRRYGTPTHRTELNDMTTAIELAVAVDQRNAELVEQNNVQNDRIAVLLRDLSEAQLKLAETQAKLTFFAPGGEANAIACRRGDETN